MLFCHHGLHIEVVIDRSHPIGRDDPAGIADVVLEAAEGTREPLDDPYESYQHPTVEETEIVA